MEDLCVKKIGAVHWGEDGPCIALLPEYAPALAGLEGFGHLQMLWWFSRCDDEQSRATLQERAPYKKGPKVLGVFATRSPQRPNPIGLSCVQVTYIDEAAGVVGLAYTDAEEGTPVLDIKPYTPSVDRVAAPQTPQWCAHWPADVESSGEFDWEDEFNF